MARRGRGGVPVALALPKTAAGLARLSARAKALVWLKRGTQHGGAVLSNCYQCIDIQYTAVFSGFDSQQLH